MPVIKNILRKAKNSFQGLKNVDVFIEDTDPNSKYFNIFDLPEELPLGCSSFLIEGSELLKKEVNLKIELLDSQNNVVFTTPVDNYLEDKSRRVSIEVYEDVAAGVATLTILGELDPTKTSVPQGFRNVYNVRFNKRININKTKENDRPIRFYGPPTISVSEIVKGVIEETTGGTNQTSTVTGTIGLNVTTNKVLDSEIDVVLPTNNVDDLGEDDFISSETPKSKKTTTFNGKIGKKGKKKKKQKKFKTTYSITGNVVAMGAGTNNSTNKITSDFVGATLTITNPHQLVDTEKFPTTRYSLPTSYSTIISEVVNEKTFKVKTPYYIIDDTTKRIPVSLKSATNNASITYDSYVEETESTIFKRSYADITIGNLRTFSGDVYKAKIFTRDSNTPTDFEKIYDAFVEPPNILIDQTSATGFTNIGFFHQQSDINNNWVSSSIGGSVGALAEQNNEYLIDGLLLSGSVEKLDSLVEFRTKNSFDLEKDVDYVVKFDSYFFKDIAEFKSDRDTISTENRADLKVFLSGSGLTGNAGEEDYYLGKVEIPTNSNDEGEISNVVGSFRSAGSGSPKAWLKFKLKSGRFVIKDVSIEPFSEENFNPNYFRTIVPMPGLVNVKRSRLFDFRAEFYDVNNNEADVGATLERVNFDGTPTIIQGEDNKLSGSLLVGDSIEMYGTNPAYLRSVGYQGFAHTIANNKGGFLLFSGSIGSGASGGNRLTASEAYQGVGLEIVDAHTSTDRFLKFRTEPSTFQVVTDEFLLGTKGSTNNYISGSANGKLEISSSNFELNGATGNVILQGTITAQAGGTIGGFTIGSASMFSGAEATPTFFLSGSGHSGTNFVKSNLFISSSGFQVNSTGAISASLGRVGGFTITDTQLSAGDDADFFGILPGTGIQMGDSTFSDAKFSVTNAGALKSTSGTMGGFTIAAGTLTGGNVQLAAAGTIKVGGLANATTTATTNAGFFADNSGNVLIKGNTNNNNYIKVTGAGGIDIKSTTFDLDATTLILDSGTNSGVIKLGASGGPGSATGTSNGGAYIDGTGKFNFVGDANNFIRFNSSGLEINTAKFDVNTSGEITATGGTIGGFTITSTELFSLDSGTPDSSPNNGITIDTTGGSNSKAVIRVFDGTTENAALGNFASGKFGIKAIEGDIGGFTIDSDEIKSTNLLLDSSNEKITLGSANAITLQGGNPDNFIAMGGKSTFDQTGTAGIIIGMDATVPKLDLTKGTGNDNYLRFDGSNGLDIKTPSFKLDTDRLDIDSSTSRISVFDDAGSPKEVVRIGEVDGASNFGMKIFDGTGTADGDILVEFSETTNNIAGWVIGTSTIQGGNLVLNKEGTIESADFSSGNIAGSGTGFRLSALDNGFLEVENARIRGTLSTAVFEKETVNAVGGQLLIGNSTTITGSGGLSGVTASSATMSVENVTGFTGSYNGFNAAGAVSNINNVDGEILIIKKVDNTGFSTEYVCVNSASRNTPSDDNNLSGLLYVTRSFGLGTATLGAGPGSNFTGSVGEGAKNYEDGQVVVSTGRYISGTGESTVGTGYINLNARPTDGATPYIDIVERTGSKVYEMDLKARLGDLSGISTAKVGSSPGFGLFTDRAFLTQDVTVGTLSGEHVLISGSYLAFKNNNTIMAQLEGTTWTLGGQTGTTEDAIKIAPGGVFIYDNSNDYVSITSAGLSVFEGDASNPVAVFGTDATIGLDEAGKSNVFVDSNGNVDIRRGTQVSASFGTTTTIGPTTGQHISIDSDSLDIKAASTVLSTFGTDAIIGEVGSGKRNVKIDSDAGILIRNNTTDLANFDTDITLGEVGTNKRNVFIDASSGVHIRNNTTDIASFGSDVTLTGGTFTINDGTRDRLIINSSDITMTDEAGNDQFNVDTGVVTIGSATDKVTINGTSGITIRENNADSISLVNGVITVGSSTDKVTINGTSGITIRENNSDTISMVNGVVTIGSSTDQVEINGTSGITIRENNKDNITLTDGTIKVGVDENNSTFVQIDSDSVDIIEDVSGTNNTVASFGVSTTIGSSTDKVSISDSGITIRENNKDVISMASDVVTIGSSTDKVTINGTSGITIRENNSDTISMINGVVTIGSSTDQVEINGTSGITIRENNKDNISLTNGTIKIGVDENNGAFAQLDGSTLDFITDSSGTNTTRASIGATTTIGNTSTEHIKVTATKFELKRGSEVFVSASSAGLYTSGSINASSGEIAGYSITDGTIEKKSGDAGVTIDGNNSRIIVSGSSTDTTGNSVRLFGNSGVIEVSQSGAGVFDTGRTKTFTTQTFIEPQIFKPGSGKLAFISSSTTTLSPSPTMESLDVTSNAEIGGLLKTDKLSVDSNALSTPFSFVNSILRNNAATNNDGAVHPTASFAVLASTDYADNNVESNCHPAFVFSADYFTGLTADDNKIGWVQNGSPPSGSNVFTIQTTVDEADNDDFADAKFNVLGLETNTSGVKNDIQNEYTFLQAKHSGSVRLQIQHDGDVVSKGNLTAFGTSFLTVSDEREKKDIYQISESLDKVLELRPTKFTWKETNKQDVGFIAQEVEKVIPEVIETSRGFINTDNDKERKTIAYPKLVPYLVDTIQVLTKRIEELEKKVK